MFLVLLGIAAIIVVIGWLWVIVYESWKFRRWPEYEDITKFLGFAALIAVCLFVLVAG